MDAEGKLLPDAATGKDAVIFNQRHVILDCPITIKWRVAIEAQVPCNEALIQRLKCVKETAGLDFKEQKHAKLMILKPLYNWTHGVHTRKDLTALRAKLSVDTAYLAR